MLMKRFDPSIVSMATSMCSIDSIKKKKKEEDDLCLLSTSVVMTESALAVRDCSIGAVTEVIEDSVQSLFFITESVMKSENSQCIEDSPLNLIEMVCTNPECRKMQYFDSAGVKPHECKYCYGLQRFVNNNLEGKMLGDRLSEEVTTEKHFELEMLGDAELDMLDEFVVGLAYGEPEENEKCFNDLSTNYLNRIKRFALGVDADEKERDWALKQVSDKSDFLAEKLSIWSQDHELATNRVKIGNDYELWEADKELPTACSAKCQLKHEHTYQEFICSLSHDDSFWESYELARVNVAKKAVKLAKPITEDTLKWVNIYCNKFNFDVPEEHLRKMSEWAGGQFTWTCNVKRNNKANPKNGFATFIKPILPKEEGTFEFCVLPRKSSMPKSPMFDKNGKFIRGRMVSTHDRCGEWVKNAAGAREWIVPAKPVVDRESRNSTWRLCC